MPSINVISLERTPERLQLFRNVNSDLARLRVFNAVDGSKCNRLQLARDGIISKDLPYTNNALGVLLSHRTLWEVATRNPPYLTICEDDAILNRGFEKKIEQSVSALSKEWDIISWGWNFDAGVTIDMLSEVSFGYFYGDQDALRENLHRFKELQITPNLFKVINFFGTLCYSVSCVGAKKLIELCTPMQNGEIFIHATSKNLPNAHLDTALCGLYKNLNAFISLPPLAVTPNIRENSTVQNHKQRTVIYE
jgi:glycosyl transferase, family 25